MKTRLKTGNYMEDCYPFSKFRRLKAENDPFSWFCEFALPITKYLFFAKMSTNTSMDVHVGGEWRGRECLSPHSHLMTPDINILVTIGLRFGLSIDWHGCIQMMFIYIYMIYIITEPFCVIRIKLLLIPSCHNRLVSTMIRNCSCMAEQNGRYFVDDIFK